MKINRVFAIANHRTFKIKPIANLLARYVHDGHSVIDPFARKSAIGTVTNDLDPEMPTDYHLEAGAFCETLLNEKDRFDVGLFDPPYSRRQMKEMYSGIGLEFTNAESQAMSTWRHVKNPLGQLIKIGGYCICFGWNTHGMTKNRGFEIAEILLVWHGPGKNDTIVVVERKIENDPKRRSS